MNEKKEKRGRGARKNQHKEKRESMLTIKVAVIALNIQHIRI